MPRALLKFFPCSTLHRLMLKDITRIFMLCTSFLFTIILLVQSMELHKLITILRPGAGEFLLLILYTSPVLMLFIIPLACMFSVFLSILRMSEDRELIALRAGGISLPQLLPAPLLFSAVCCCLGLAVSLHGIAWGAERFRDTALHLAREKARINLQPGIFNQDINGMTMFARSINPETHAMRQVLVEDSSRGPESRLIILAPEGSLETNSRRGELVFHLRDGRIYRLEKNTVSILNFESYFIRISLDKLLRTLELKSPKPKEMSWKELLRLKAAQQREYLTWTDRKVLVEIQKRFSIPFSCLALGLFALPLAATFENAKRQTSIALALAAFLLYYFVYSLGLTVGEAGYLHPIPAAWLPNIFFLAVALAGVFGSRRRRNKG